MVSTNLPYDVLHRIMESAATLARATQSSSSLPVPCLPQPSVDPLPMPDAQVIEDRLAPLRLSSTAVTRIRDAYVRYAVQLRQNLQDKLQQPLPQSRLLASQEGLLDPTVLLRKIRNAYSSSFQKQLDQWIEQIIESIQSRKSALPMSRPPSGYQKARKLPFNTEYLPLLEHFFAENQKPSRADKEFLAKKSNMSFRQIEVWFQNQRRRRKPECTMFRKKPGHEPPTLSFDSLIARMPNRIIPEEQRVEVLDSDDSEYEDYYFSGEDDETAFAPKYKREPQARDVLDSPAPPHAFPAPYPPSCCIDPFLKDDIRKFSPPIWKRKPATTAVERPPVDFEDLLTAFSSLTVLGPIKERRKRKREDPRNPTPQKRTSPPVPRADRHAATMFITIRPPSARHPALIPAQCAPAEPLSKVPLPSVSRPASTCHVFPPPSPHAKLATLVPPPILRSVTAEKSIRKVAPLPRRTPGSKYRAVSGVSSSSTSSQTSSSNSRVSSYNPITSSHTQISSDGSAPSSAVVTPEILSQSLPEHPPMPHISLPGQLVSPSLAMQGFGLGQSSLFMSELFGDASSPADAPSIDLPYAGGKQYNMPFYFPFEEQGLPRIIS